jgi:hypothetical protein
MVCSFNRAVERKSATFFLSLSFLFLFLFFCFFFFFFLFFCRNDKLSSGQRITMRNRTDVQPRADIIRTKIFLTLYPGSPVPHSFLRPQCFSLFSSPLVGTHVVLLRKLNCHSRSSVRVGLCPGCGGGEAARDGRLALLKQSYSRRATETGRDKEERRKAAAAADPLCLFWHYMQELRQCDADC